jgi:hypothetical protein
MKGFFVIKNYNYPMSEELKYWYFCNHKLFWTLRMSKIKQSTIK